MQQHPNRSVSVDPLTQLAISWRQSKCQIFSRETLNILVLRICKYHMSNRLSFLLQFPSALTQLSTLTLSFFLCIIFWLYTALYSHFQEWTRHAMQCQGGVNTQCRDRRPVTTHNFTVLQKRYVPLFSLMEMHSLQKWWVRSI